MCVCVSALSLSAFSLPSVSQRRETRWQRLFVNRGGERDETRSYRQISAHWNPIGKVIYIVLLKSTCDLVREPIHNPDTRHSCLTLFCKQMRRMLVRPLQRNGQICVSSDHFSADPKYRVFTPLWCLFWGVSADPSTFFFPRECSVCVRLFAPLTLTTGVCLVTFSCDEDEHVEMNSATVMSLWERR